MDGARCSPRSARMPWTSIARRSMFGVKLSRGMSATGGPSTRLCQSCPDRAEKPTSRTVATVARTNPRCTRASQTSASTLLWRRASADLSISHCVVCVHVQADRMTSSSRRSSLNAANRSRSARSTDNPVRDASPRMRRRRYSPRDSPKRAACASMGPGLPRARCESEHLSWQPPDIKRYHNAQPNVAPLWRRAIDVLLRRRRKA